MQTTAWIRQERNCSEGAATWFLIVSLQLYWSKHVMWLIYIQRSALYHHCLFKSWYGVTFNVDYNPDLMAHIWFHHESFILKSLLQRFITEVKIKQNHFSFEEACQMHIEKEYDIHCMSLIFDELYCSFCTKQASQTPKSQWISFLVLVHFRIDYSIDLLIKESEF